METWYRVLIVVPSPKEREAVKKGLDNVLADLEGPMEKWLSLTERDCLACRGPYSRASLNKINAFLNSPLCKKYNSAIIESTYFECLGREWVRELKGSVV